MNLGIKSAVERLLDAEAVKFLIPPDARAVSFLEPPGEAALVSSDSISWRVFKNPVTLFIGGVTAVILELAEPRVRTGVWEHTSFKTDPAGRLKRTGLAAMVTVYGARSVAEATVAGIGRRHARVRGSTSSGLPYRADDPALLEWVHATAAFGFLNAYCTYAETLPAAARDAYYAEGAIAAKLYGAERFANGEADFGDLLIETMPGLEASPIVAEFLQIMKHTPLLPAGAGFLQRLMVDAAVDLTPLPVRDRLGLGTAPRLRSWQRSLVSGASQAANRLVLRSSPAVQACLRVGLAENHLYCPFSAT